MQGVEIVDRKPQSQAQGEKTRPGPDRIGMAGKELELGPGGCLRVEQDFRGNRMDFIFVDGNFFDHAGLDTLVHDPGLALDDAVARGQFQGHGQALLGHIETLVKNKTLAVARLRTGSTQ